MSEKDDGGRAFPFAYETSHPEEHGINGGMALRDYFAAKAMQAYCSHSKSCDWMPHEIAADAYLMADAMLKARDAKT